MTDRAPPHDLEVERHLLGACMITPRALESSSRLVTAGDFHRPSHGHVYQALLDLWNGGEPTDAPSVADRLRSRGQLDGIAPELTAMQAACPATTSADRYARIVVEHAARRRLLAVAAELAEAAYGLGDPAALVDRARAELEAVDLPQGRTDGLWRLDDLLDLSDGERAPWVVPGLARRDWRVVIVAGEGVGKSLLLQQIAVCAAQGVHPLSHKRGMRPVRALLIDAENPEQRIVEGCKPIRSQSQRIVGAAYDRERAWLWHRPGGIDVRTRRDRSALESVLAATRPELVCLGPTYKLAERQPREGWEETARAVQATFDDLRTRYGFALIMEDHAPQAERGVRELRPFGSSLWLRWPEIGLKLVSEGGDFPPRVLKLRRWRGDRLPSSWPDELHRGGVWPWDGYWANGVEDDW